MTSITDYDNFDGLALAEMVGRREIHAKELLDAAIARLDALNPRVNAICQRLYDTAMTAIEAGLPAGPFQGVPFPIKDLSCQVTGSVTTNGSRRYKTIADHDSTIIARYRAAGLVLFAKSSTPEFGGTVSTEPVLFGATRNPWNLERSAGGSSGGAAAAVASGMVPMAHASDGGGSIRIPASCCGLVGLKPSRARMPAGPDRGEGWAGLSTQHAVTRSVRDCAALLDATAGGELGEPYPPPAQAGPFLAALERPPKALRIAYWTKPLSGAPIDPECAEAVENTAALLRDMGHELVEAAPDYSHAALYAALSLIIGANTAAAMDADAEATGRALREDEFEPLTWRMAANAREAGADAYVKAVHRIHEAGRIAARFHKMHDLWLTPVLARPPAPLGVFTLSAADVRAYLDALNGYAVFTAYANMTGQPAISLPLHWTRDGMPVGIMLTARYGEEALLLALARQAEIARPWFDRRPPLH